MIVKVREKQKKKDMEMEMEMDVEMGTLWRGGCGEGEMGFLVFGERIVWRDWLRGGLGEGCEVDCLDKRKK